MQVVRCGDDFQNPSAERVHAQPHQNHGQQSRQRRFEMHELLQFSFFNPCFSSGQKMIEQHEHASENQSAKHVRKERGIPWP